MLGVFFDSKLVTRILNSCPVPHKAGKFLMGTAVQGIGSPGGQLSAPCNAPSFLML